MRVARRGPPTPSAATGCRATLSVAMPASASTYRRVSPQTCNAISSQQVLPRFANTSRDPARSGKREQDRVGARLQHVHQVVPAHHMRELMRQQRFQRLQRSLSLNVRWEYQHRPASHDDRDIDLRRLEQPHWHSDAHHTLQARQVGLHRGQLDGVCAADEPSHHDPPAQETCDHQQHAAYPDCANGGGHCIGGLCAFSDGLSAPARRGFTGDRDRSRTRRS